MANKVLGIEISQNLTRVVEMDFKVKNPKIYNMFNFVTPPDMINDGGIEPNTLFGSTLHAKLKEHHISTNKVLFVLNSARIANREVEIPNVKDSRIKELLMANGSDYFPVDLNQYELVHEVIGRINDGDEKKIRLSVIAVPNEIIRSYELLAKSCGLTLVGLDYTGNAIKQLMLREIPGEIKVTIKVDESLSILTIMEGEDIKLQRILNYGIAEAVEEIQESELFGEYLTFVDAMDVARRRTVMNMKFDDSSTEDDEEEDYEYGVDSEKLKALKRNVTYSLQTLVGSIARVLDYYQSRNTEKTIDKIFLIGMGADFSGLSKLMSNELNYKVVPIQQFEGLTLHKGLVLADIVIPEYFTCIGSLIKPLPIINTDKRGKKGKSKSEGDEEGSAESLTSSLAILALCCVVAIALGGLSVYQALEAKTQNMTLKKNVADLAYAQEICDQYNATKAKYDWILQLEDNTTTHNDNLLAFIDELEKKLPSQAQILAFTADKEVVGFTIKVNSKAAVADVVSQLRTFETITVSSVSSIVEEEDEAGAKSVAFAVGCKYVDKTAETNTEE